MSPATISARIARLWRDPRVWWAAVAALLVGLAGPAWLVADTIPLVPVRPFCVSDSHERRPIEGRLSSFMRYLVALSWLGTERPVRIVAPGTERSEVDEIHVTLSDWSLDRTLMLHAVMDWATAELQDWPYMHGRYVLDLTQHVADAYWGERDPQADAAKYGERLRRAKAGLPVPPHFMTHLRCHRFPSAALEGGRWPRTGIK